MREEKSCRNFEDTLIPLAVESSPSTLRINVQSFLTASFLYGNNNDISETICCFDATFDCVLLPNYNYTHFC